MSRGAWILRVVVMERMPRRISALRPLLPAIAALSLIPAPAGAATIPVDTSIDEPSTQNGNCTLREALVAAGSNSAIDACPAGSAVEPDVVLLLDTSHAWSAGFAFVSAGGPLVLRGPDPAPKGCYVIVSPPVSLRFLKLLNGADLTIENCEIREGDASTDQNVATGGALLAMDLSDVKLTLRNVAFRLNKARAGGAVYVETSSTCSGCRVTIEGSLFAQNAAEHDSGVFGVRGGALVLQLRGDTQARIVDTTFEWNEARSDFAGNQATGGAFYAGLSDTATLEIRRSAIYSNSAVAGAGAAAVAGGAAIWPFGASTLLMEDIDLQGNQLVGPAAGAWPATALDIHSGFSGSFALDRLFFYGNDWSEDGVDLRLEHNSPEPVSARNILLAAGPRRAAEVLNWGSGAIGLSHWTVTDHVERGLRLWRNAGTGALRLDNSIVWANGTEIVQEGFPTVDPANNLIGVNPQFEAPALGGFRLTALSPAIDLGDPAWSGGRYDVAHAPRSAALAPDAGAYERGGLFADGFESGDSGAWSAVLP
jgi:hypothetical protein